MRECIVEHLPDVIVGEPVVDVPSLAAMRHETRITEYSELVTDGRLAHIEGLLTSTFLNMVVVPVLFDRFGDREALRSASENQSLRD